MSIKDRMKQRVETHIAKKVEKKLGNKSLSYVAKVVRGTIRIAGVAQVRNQVIKGIESDIQNAIKENPDNPREAVEKLMKEAINTPDYMALLKDLSMDEYSLCVLVEEALK